MAAVSANNPKSDDAPTGPGSSLGETLKTWRVARGLSQRALAARAGIAWSTIARWEGGKTQPTLPEWEAVLRALEIGADEGSRSLALLHAPRALRAQRTRANDTLPGNGLGRPPIGGDLLRALRLRRGWRQAQVAEAIGVRQGIVARWEAGDLWPPLDQLHALCRLLNAAPEEVAALTIGRFSLASLLDIDDPDHLHLEQWRLLHRQGNCFPVALTDLRYFALEARLHTLLSSPTGGSDARRGRLESVLSWTYARHAQYLAAERRFGEVGAIADRAHSLREYLGTRRDDEGWVPALVARATGDARGRNASSASRPDFTGIIRNLRRELPGVQRPDYQAWVLSEIATYAVPGCEYDLAVRLSAESLRMVENAEGPTMVAERRLRRRDHAALLVKAGDAPTAARYLPHLDGTAWNNQPLQNIRDLFVTTRILLALRDRPGATHALHQSLNLLDTVANVPSPGQPADGAAVVRELTTEAETLALGIG